MLPLLSHPSFLFPIPIPIPIPIPLRYSYSYSYSHSHSHSNLSRSLHPLPFHPPHASITNSNFNASNGFDNYKQQNLPSNQKPRTLFPGGYKRSEIKTPTLILQLDADEVLNGGDALNLINKAVSKWVGIVVLNSSSDDGGGRLYEAASLLKPVIGERAYFMVSDRVDIAAAAQATGVLLSDQGLPTVVARNTLMDSKSESVVLPLVARIVQTVDAAVKASKSEGADFLIYGKGDLKIVGQELSSVYENVKIPIFISCTSRTESMSYSEVSSLLNSGASGFVISLGNFGLFDDDLLHKLFDAGFANDKRILEGRDSHVNEHELLNSSNDFQSKTEGLAGFVKLEGREKRLIESERSVLNEAIEAIKKAAPLVIF